MIFRRASFTSDLSAFFERCLALDLVGRTAIQALEGAEDRHLDEYARHGSEKNLAMIDRICKQLRLTTLKYQRMDDMVAAIGLPKERLCTHCWEGRSDT